MTDFPVGKQILFGIHCKRWASHKTWTRRHRRLYFRSNRYLEHGYW